MKPEEVIAELTRRIYRLEQEVADLRRRQGLPARPERKDTPPPAMQPSPPHRPQPQPSASPVRPSASGAALEANVIGTWFARVGMIAILIGAGFAFKYAVDRGVIGPYGRVAIGMIAGLAFAAWGEAVHRRGWDLFAQAVTGGAIALWYLSILSALHLFDLVAPGTAFVALVAVTVAGAALATRQDSLALAALAIVGAFLNPFLVGADSLDPIAFLTYVAAVDLFVLALAPKRWDALDRLALVGTVAVVLAVTPRESFSQRVGFATVLFTIFVIVLVVRAVVRDAAEEDTDRRRSPAPDVLVGVTAAYYGYVMWALDGEHPGWRGIFTLALALLYGAGAYASRWAPVRMDAPLLTIIAMVLGALFVPIQLSGVQIAAGWAVEGLVLAFVADRFDDDRLHIAANVLLGVAATAALGTLADAYPPERLLGTWESFFAVVTIALLGVTAVVVSRAEARRNAPSLTSDVLAVAANVVAIVWLSQEIAAAIARSLDDPSQPTQFSLTAFWGVYAAGLLATGVALRARWARLAGVGLFAITVGKLAVSDLWLLRTPYRIVAFLGLGFILLICSVMYQRFRDLLLADDEPDTPPRPDTQPPARPRPPARAGSAKKPAVRKTTRPKA